MHVSEEAPVRSPWNAAHGADAAVRRWLVVAPYIRSETGAWLHHFVDPGFGFQFETVPVRVVHPTRRRRTNSLEWLTLAEQANRAWRQAHAGPQPAGIVTVFPPPARRAEARCPSSPGPST